MKKISDTIREKFDRLIELRKGTPTAPDDWDPGEFGSHETRRDPEGRLFVWDGFERGGWVYVQEAELAPPKWEAPEYEEDDVDGLLVKGANRKGPDGKTWGYHVGAEKWIPLDPDDETKLRRKLLAQITAAFAKIDPITVGEEDYTHVYDILWSLSLGLGHGATGKATADSIILFLDTVTDKKLHWASLFVKAALWVKDYESAHNILESLTERGKTPMRHQHDFASAKSLHLVYYAGKALLSACHVGDLPAALEWARRGRRNCAGVPGAQQTLRGITRSVRKAQKKIESGEFEDDFDAIEYLEDELTERMAPRLTGAA